MNKIKLTIILTLFAVLCTAAYGQVTVGSSQPPVNGALLDIKEFDPNDPNDPKPDNTTAKKGLLMPRVNLSKKDQLYPMFESTTTPGTANADYNDGTKKLDQDKKHTGLIVYNVTPVSAEGLDVGVHSWDGTKWVAVKSGSGAAGTYNFVDPIIYDSGSGNVYLQAGTADGQVLKWNNTTSKWEAGTDANTTYTGTAPIAINGSYQISLNDGGVGLSKLTPGGTSGQVLTSNGASAPSWTTLSINDADYIVGNEVTDATSSGGLVRAGSGTAVSPYTLGIADNGVTTARINAGAVTTAKIADANVTPAKIAGSATVGQVLTTTTANAAPTWVTPTDNDTQYTGTAPIAINGSHQISLNDGGVGLSKLTPGGTSGQVLTSNGASAPSWTTLSVNDADYIVGNEVTDATSGGGLVRAGSGTTGSPYTLGIADNGVTTARINAGAVTTAKIAGGTDGYVLTATGTSTAPQWKELKSSGGGASTSNDGTTGITLPAGSGTWYVIFSVSVPNGTFKASSGMGLYCYGGQVNPPSFPASKYAAGDGLYTTNSSSDRMWICPATETVLTWTNSMTVYVFHM